MDALVAQLKKLADKASLTAKELSEAEALIVEVEKIVESARQLRSEAETRDPAYGAIQAKEDALVSAPEIYMTAVREAVALSEEYAYEAFLAPLLDIAFDDDLFQTRQIGYGWNSKLSVHLAMDEVAGDIQDYADGVESARGALGVKDGRDPQRASQLWRDRFYKGPRYFTTINLRLAAASGKAPFWSLLNDGNKLVSMNSDIGGNPYPENGPTHFVEETQSKIAREYEFFLMQYRDQSNGYIMDLTSMILTAEVAIDKIRSYGRVLDGPPDDPEMEDEFLERIAKDIEFETKKISKSKLYKAKDKLLSGEYLPAQISIQGPGEKRKRIRRGKFIKLVLGGGE